MKNTEFADLEMPIREAELILDMTVEIKPVALFQFPDVIEHRTRVYFRRNDAPVVLS
jgi:negative regulator of replication initiation